MFFFKYFLLKGYELSGEIAFKNSHYYYYVCLPPDKIYELLHSMQSCIGNVKLLATANILRHNDNKI